MEAGDLKKLEIAADNTRFKLLGLLVKHESYATKLSRQLKVKRKTIAFRLKQLEGLGLVHGKYMIKEDEGIAIKNYKITQEGKRVYDHILAF